ncbi:MAG: RHS repeat-associated core domain-containing protein, partial [Desulfobacterales bacterium]|nr:RHS repeat-associated core domain-containing protein [Desulfobacterales bacterium]
DRLVKFTLFTPGKTQLTEYTFHNYNRKTEVITEEETTIKSRTYYYDETQWLTLVEDDADVENSFNILYFYDKNGNTISKIDGSLTNRETTFIYNSLDQLVQTTRGPPGAEIILGQYDYNAAGLRVRHRHSERGDVDYYYDQTAVIEERNADDGALLAHYNYADRLLSLNTEAGVQYYHHDALGSTVNLTDSAGDTLVSYTLDPWGHIRSQTGTSVNRQIFTGQEHDENTGLIYFGRRYYEPDVARFISQDPYLGANSIPPSV